MRVGRKKYEKPAGVTTKTSIPKLKLKTSPAKTGICYSYYTDTSFCFLLGMYCIWGGKKGSNCFHTTREEYKKEVDRIYRNTHF